MTTKDLCRQTLYRTLCLHIYGGGNVYLERDIKKNQEALLTFLRGQDARYGSFESWLELNKIGPLIIAASIVKKNNKKMEILHFLRATFTQEEFPRS